MQLVIAINVRTQDFLDREGLVHAALATREPQPPDDPIAFELRVKTLMAELVEPSKSKAYDELGDGWHAHKIAVEWLRSSL